MQFVNSDGGFAPVPPRVAAAIDAIYAQVPSLRCKGLCVNDCSMILMSTAEAARIGEHRGSMPVGRVRLDIVGQPGWMSCPLLTADGRCEEYERRPLVCRLYGTTSAGMLHCKHGCERVDGKPLLTPLAAQRLMVALLHIDATATSFFSADEIAAIIRVEQEREELQKLSAAQAGQ